MVNQWLFRLKMGTESQRSELDGRSSHRRYSTRWDKGQELKGGPQKEKKYYFLPKIYLHLVPLSLREGLGHPVLRAVKRSRLFTMAGSRDASWSSFPPDPFPPNVRTDCTTLGVLRCSSVWKEKNNPATQKTGMSCIRRNYRWGHLTPFLLTPTEPCPTDRRRFLRNLGEGGCSWAYMLLPLCESSLDPPQVREKIRLKKLMSSFRGDGHGTFSVYQHQLQSAILFIYLVCSSLHEYAEEDTGQPWNVFSVFFWALPNLLVFVWRCI